MIKKVFGVVLLGFILILSSCTTRPIDIIEGKEGKSNEEISKGEDNTNEKILEEQDKITEEIANMTIEEKIGQLFIFGFSGGEIDGYIIDLIKEDYIGGFILFKENIKSVEQGVDILNKLKEANRNNKIPLFLAIDEEGGRVSRLPKPFLKMPSPKMIGNINDKDISFQYGKIQGSRLRTLGFNMNFAPVMDINSNPNNPVIGDRAFGSTVDRVVDNSIQVMEGIRAEKIIPVIKHFPGHGDTKTDSHIDLPIVNKTIDEVEKLELIPFAKGIEGGADSIMIGHILFPELDDTNPATLSNTIINNILREKLSFDGVIISDDMTMGAITKSYSMEDAVIKFFQAGGDIALICHGDKEQLSVLDRVKEELEKGNIKEEDIDEKVYRIIKLKRKYEINDNIIYKADIEKVNMKTRKFLDKIKAL